MKASKKTLTEKRSYKRLTHEVPILMTRFNTRNWSHSQILNLCPDGICIRSNAYFKPGTAIVIRVAYCASMDSHKCTFEGLPSTILGEIKWCRKIIDATPSYYEIGVKYYVPNY